MELLPMTFASGFAAGINTWATVLVLGLCGRFAHTGGVPEGFQRIDVLIVMAVLTAIELVADKVPWLDSVWDSLSTVVRPVGGAVVGALIAGAHGDLPTIALAAVGGVTALLSHLGKAAVRLAINSSPEPVTNWAHSVTGDVTVVGVASLAAFAPLAAAVLAGAVLVLVLLLAWTLARRIRRGYRRVQEWRRRRSGTPPRDDDGPGASAARP